MKALTDEEFEALTSAEKREYCKRVRDEMDTAPHDPTDDSLQILHAFVADESKPQ